MVEKDKAKQARPFIDYIKDPERAPEILAQLHRWIDNSRKSKALVYLKAATEARVLEQPPYPAAAAEFPGRLGSKDRQGLEWRVWRLPTVTAPP